jgi:hypothetical protein
MYISSVSKIFALIMGVGFFGMGQGRADTSYIGFNFSDRVESAISNQYNGLTQSFRNVATGVDMRITTSTYGAARYDYTVKTAAGGDLQARYTSTAGWNATDNPVAGSNPLGINYTLNFYEADAGHTFSIAKVLSNFRLLTYDVDGSNSGTSTSTVNGVTTTTKTIVQSERVRVLPGSGFVSYQLTNPTKLTVTENAGAWEIDGDNVDVNFTLPSMAMMNFANTSEVKFQFEAPYSRNANDPVATYLDGDLTFITQSQFDTFTAPTPAGVPEPSALSLLAIGLGGLAILRRRRS